MAHLANTKPILGAFHEREKKMKRAFSATLMFVPLMASSMWTANAGAATFRVLENLSGTQPSSIARAISADGRFIVGSSYTGSGIMNHAVRWDVRGGILDLGDIPGGNSYSHASAISADGSTVVGQGSIGTNYGDRAAMWTEVTGMYSLGALPGVTTSTAKAVSSDGTVVVGGGSSRAFRWTSQSGMVDLGYGVANGVSADGSVVVGTYNALDTAFRWTQEEGLVSLGVLPGDYYSSGGNAISADGSVIVGASVRVGATQAYRWTSETGMVGLGDLPGGAYFSSPTTVSPDGSIVLGRSNTAMGDEAMIWDASHGMRNLREVFAIDYGLDMTGWLLTQANGISTDNSTIIGVGKYQGGAVQSWVFIVPEPGTGSLLVLGLAVSKRRRSIHATRTGR